MKSRIEDSDNIRMLKFYDDLIIQNADEFKTILGESLEAAGILIINVESVAEIDLSCLQLLCALHKSAMLAGKTVTLDYNRSPLIKETLLEAGFIRHTGCSGSEKCFWTEIPHG
jgi:anti-anti-sigma regulatory factor